MYGILTFRKIGHNSILEVLDSAKSLPTKDIGIGIQSLQVYVFADVKFVFISVLLFKIAGRFSKSESVFLSDPYPLNVEMLPWSMQIWGQ